jgi:GT2 family glycosyltransferase
LRLVAVHQMVVFQLTYSATSSPAACGVDAEDHRLLALFFFAYSSDSLCLRIEGRLPCLLGGFYPEENDGRWSAGRRSLLLLEKNSANHNLRTLEIFATAFRGAFRSCRVDILTSQGLRGRVRIGRRKRYVVRLQRPWFKRSSRLVVGDFSEIETPHNVSLGGAKPKVSLIIPNHDRAYLTRLSAVAAASSHISVPFEIVCMDNGSSRDCIDTLARSEVPLRVVELGANKGFAEACNAGAKEARGDYVVFLNNDAFLRPGTIDELLVAFAADPDCGAAGPVMLNIDDSLQEAGCSIQPDGFPVRHGREYPSFDLQSLPRFEPVDYVSGACLMVKRDEFLSMGGFQTKYSPAYYEDTDFCLRLLMRGKRVYLASQTSCYHIENATSRDIENGAWATRTSEAHRAIFLQDWAPYLASRNPADFPKL